LDFKKRTTLMSSGKWQTYIYEISFKMTIGKR